MVDLRKFMTGILCLGLLSLLPGVTNAAIRAKNDTGHRMELNDQRTAYSKTYRNPDGTTTLAYSTVPYHFLNSKNQWEDIDTSLEDAGTLKDEDGGPFGYKVIKNTFQSYFPRRSNGWLTLQSGQTRLGFKLVNGKTGSFRRQHTSGLSVPDILENCDLNYAVKEGSLKEDIVLKSRKSPKSFEYAIRLRNLKLSKTADGEINFCNKQGNPVFIMSKFIMYDAKGISSEDIDIRVQQKDKDYQLIVAPSRQWLNDSARVYPVVIDPTITVTTTSPKPINYILYIPSNYIQDFTRTKDTQDVTLTNPGNLKIKPYAVHVDCTYTINSSSYSVSAKPTLKSWKCDSNGTVIDAATFLVNATCAIGKTNTSSFDIPANFGAKMQFYTGKNSNGYGYNATFSLTFQNETVSPPGPVLTLLAPENYKTAVNLSWSIPSDESNPDIDPGTGQPTPQSGIDKYFVQRSTSADFSTDIATTESLTNSCTISGLAYNQSYYFRVYAQDKDKNPLNMNPWDPVANPSGVRWSNIVATKCIPAPENLNNPDNVPRITDIESNYKENNIYYSSNRNLRVSWLTSNLTVPDPFVKVAAGFNHTLAINSAGMVWAWGDNTYGQLGNGNKIMQTTPVLVKLSDGTPLTNITDIKAGQGHSIALKSDGTVWAWGWNKYGQLGNGTVTDSLYPVQVKQNSLSPLSNITAIGAGDNHTLAVKSDGTAWAWGYDYYGQVGDGTSGSSTGIKYPVQVKTGTTFLTGITAISGGVKFSLALKNDGTVWSWGYNGDGSLGDGTTTNRNKAVQVAFNPDPDEGSTSIDPQGSIVAIAAGKYSLALTDQGNVWEWGNSQLVPIGINIFIQSGGLIHIGILSGINIIAAGINHSLTIDDHGVNTWGNNDYGQLGSTQLISSATPNIYRIGGQFDFVAGGNTHSVALKKDGSIWTWGNNISGQLGTSNNTASNIPINIISQPQAQLRIIKYQDQPESASAYPLQYITDITAGSAPTNWNLADGHYVIYFAAPDVGALTWSAGTDLIIDTTPPEIAPKPETIDGNNVYLHFASNEAVRFKLYWGEDPENLNSKMDTNGYQIYKGTENSICIPSVNLSQGKHYYYYFECADKTGNITKSSVCTIGDGSSGNTISHTDSSFYGFESYWDFKTIGLGRAGIAQVNLNNGNLVIAATDFILPGRRIPLMMSRYYNSLADYEGMLGKGWRSSLESFLEINGQNVIINDPDGSRHTFEYISPGEYTHPAGDYRRVVLNSDQSYLVSQKDGTRYRYSVPVNNIAKLTAIEDRFGNVLKLIYNADGTLNMVEEPSGKWQAHFTYYLSASGKELLDTVTFTPADSDSREIKYIYFSDRLIDVYYPYDDGMNKVDVKYGYDLYTGLLSSSAVGLVNGSDPSTMKNVTNFYYKICSRSIDSVRTSFSTYNENFSNLTLVNKPVAYLFDYDNSVTTFTDPNQNVYVYQHDDNGQCIKVTLPAYFDSDKDISYSGVIQFGYDANYNLISTTLQKPVYDPQAMTTTVRDVVTAYNYDTNGNLLSMTADAGENSYNQNIATNIAYESNHHDVLTDIKSITDPKGNVTRYINQYDTNGKLTGLTINSPSDYVIIHTFDEYGERIRKEVKLKNSNNPDNINSATSKAIYDYGYENGLLKNMTNAYGTAKYNYTTYGELTELIDANQVKTVYNINSFTGNLTSIMAPVELDESGNPLSQKGQFNPYNALTSPKSQYVYDISGKTTGAYDADNHYTVYFYDSLNQLSKVTTPSLPNIGSYNSYNRYDANGNLLQTRDLNGNYTCYTYDALNRPAKISDLAGKTEKAYVYDEADRVKISYDGKQNRAEYYYDSVDNLLRTIVYDAQNNNTSHITTYSYDKNGNLLSKSVPISSSLDETGTIDTTYQYDTVNRPIKVDVVCQQNNKYSQTINYTYQAGQLSQMSVSFAGRPESLTYGYEYDSAQRLVTLWNENYDPSNGKWLGYQTKFDYFPGGQRKTKSLYKNRTDTTPFISVDYAYDTAYRLNNLDYQWGSYYLKLGYTYNELDKITDNSVVYNVNAPDVTNFLRSQLPSTATVSVDQHLKGSYTNHYTYDDLGRLTFSKVYGINPVLKWDDTYQRQQKTTFANLDANGNPGLKTVQTLNSNGDWDTTTENNTYNYLNQLLSKSVNAPQTENDYSMTSTYDENGNEIKEHFNDGRPGDTTFQYGLDNQLLKYIMESKHKDEQNEAGTGTIDAYYQTTKNFSYELGGLLRRVKTVTHDSTNPCDMWSANYNDYFYYSHDGVVAELNDDTSKFKGFTRFGRELINCSSSTEGTYFYLQNLRGDVMMLVKDNGDVKSIRDYDVSGEMLSQAPRDRDPFGFIGGIDARNGLWKLGARFYNSSNGGFIQQDRYMGNPGDPLSLNRYVYCKLDPVNYVDPDGFDVHDSQGRDPQDVQNGEGPTLSGDQHNSQSKESYSVEHHGSTISVKTKNNYDGTYNITTTTNCGGGNIVRISVDFSETGESFGGMATKYWLSGYSRNYNVSPGQIPYSDGAVTGSWNYGINIGPISGVVQLFNGGPGWIHQTSFGSEVHIDAFCGTLDQTYYDNF
ncbi:MAG TPA: hypothetical protein DDW65_10610 [Firmicutes bacterium]|jgi:RHS repeat-associated protein|nr:hypothetical protein [Bacillota bacterium]